MRPTSVILLALLVLAGCRGSDDRQAQAAPPAVSARVEVPPDGLATAGVDALAPAMPDAASVRGGPDDPLAEKLRHCPLTVEGAVTEIADLDGGVGLTITAPDEAASAEIRRRTAHVVALTAGQADRAAHGGGEGGGRMRNCPVVISDTRVTATDVPGGSRLVVRPTAGLTVAALRRETRRRRDALGTP